MTFYPYYLYSGDVYRWSVYVSFADVGELLFCFFYLAMEIFYCRDFPWAILYSVNQHVFDFIPKMSVCSMCSFCVGFCGY